MEETKLISRKGLVLGGVLVLLLLCALYLYEQRGQSEVAVPAVAETLPLPDTLRVVTLSGSTTYFQYRDEEMGYQYELLKSYAGREKLPFVLEVVPSIDSIHSLLRSGRADLSITPEVVDPSRQEGLRYTGPVTETSMVLVQHRARERGDSLYLRNVTELLGKEVYVQAGSKYMQRLHNLEEQLGGEIEIQEVGADSLDTEELIAQVNSQTIRYTVVDLDIARQARRYYPNIDIALEVGFTRKQRWLTSSRHELLAESIDAWSASEPKVRKGIYQKYFEAKQSEGGEATPSVVMESLGRVYTLKDGAISPFDELFRAEEGRLGWPWQLLASIAYQESNFKHEVIGWSGARGLMGIMPRTGRIYGASKEELLDPKVSVRVSVDCLLANRQALSKQIEDKTERLKFTLAAYNAGMGHVIDAQNLARKYGHNPYIWDDNVEIYVLLKSERRYYSDPVCKHGYLRGRETYKYVKEVMHRLGQYKALTE